MSYKTVDKIDFHTYDAYQKKGDHKWTYAKNVKGDKHYAKASESYEKERINREESEKLKGEL